MKEEGRRMKRAIPTRWVGAKRCETNRPRCLLLLIHYESGVYNKIEGGLGVLAQVVYLQQVANLHRVIPGDTGLGSMKEEGRMMKRAAFRTDPPGETDLNKP